MTEPLFIVLLSLLSGFAFTWRLDYHALHATGDWPYFLTMDQFRPPT